MCVINLVIRDGGSSPKSWWTWTSDEMDETDFDNEGEAKTMMITKIVNTKDGTVKVKKRLIVRPVIFVITGIRSILMSGIRHQLSLIEGDRMTSSDA